MALERATPTRVATTMTVNPIAAGLLATQLVGEPITPNLVLGLVAVFAGIWIATTEAKAAKLATAEHHAAAMASISIRKSGPYSFDTSTRVTAGAAGGVTEAKKRVSCLAIGAEMVHVGEEHRQLHQIGRPCIRGLHAIARLRNTCAACAGKSSLPTTRPSRSSAVWPAMKMMRLALTSTI